MSKSPESLNSAPFEYRKRNDRAMALPLLGTVMLVSPFLNAVAGLKTVLGLPVAYVYIFCVWAFLILLTARLARLLLRDP